MNDTKRKTPSSVWRNPLHFIAFGFGSGAAPVAPGTFGTLASIPLFLLIQDLPLLSYFLVILVGFIIGIPICGKTADDLGVHDHSGIVWDEFVGFWITMFAAPKGWLWVLAGFILFRFFDVIKPWPITVLDKRVSGGLGIMIDDVVAGIFAAICLQFIVYLV